MNNKESCWSSACVTWYKDNRILEKYKYGKISLEQLKAFQSNYKNFRIEAYSPNRGYLYEKTIFEITKGFSWLSSESNTWKEFKYAD